MMILSRTFHQTYESHLLTFHKIKIIKTRLEKALIGTLEGTSCSKCFNQFLLFVTLPSVPLLAASPSPANKYDKGVHILCGLIVYP